MRKGADGDWGVGGGPWGKGGDGDLGRAGLGVKVQMGLGLSQLLFEVLREWKVGPRVAWRGPSIPIS